MQSCGSMPFSTYRVRPCICASARETKIQLLCRAPLGHADVTHVEVTGCDPRFAARLPFANQILSRSEMV